MATPVSDVFLNATNPLVDLSTTSLVDLKSVNLRDRLAKKQQKINPAPSLADALSEFNNGSKLHSNFLGDLADLAESDVYTSIENIGNIITGDSNPNRRAESDLIAGVDPRIRQEMSDAYDASTTSLAQGIVDFQNDDYLSAGKNILQGTGEALAYAPEYLADSAGSALEALAGTALTAAPEVASSVAGAGLLGKRAKAVGGAVNKFSDSIKQAKKRIQAGDSDIADKALVAIAKTGKATSQTSLMTANYLQEIREDYIQENGKDPSSTWMAVNGAIGVASMTMQLGVFKKFFPTKAGAKKDIAGLKEYTKEMKAKLGLIPKGFVKQVAGRIYKGSKKVMEASGAEAAQEYLQTWHEILAVKVQDPAALADYEKELSSIDNNAQAVFGLIVGAGAAGTARGVTIAPGLATGVAVDTALKTGSTAIKVVKATGEFVAEKGAKKATKLLSSEEQRENAEKYEVQKAEHEELVADRDQKLAAIENIDSLATITDPELTKAFNDVAGTDDLNNARNFIKAREVLIRKFKSDKDKSAIALDLNRTGRILATEGTRIIKNVGKLVNITKEDIDKLVVKAKVLGTKAVEELKNFNTSSTYGLAEKAIDYGTVQTKDGLKALHAEIKENTPEVVRKLADTLQEDMPNAAQALYAEANRRDAGLKLAGFKENKKLINVASIPDSLKDIRQKKYIPKNAISVGRELQTAIEGRPENIDTIDMLQDALDVYKESPLYRNKEKGSLSPETVAKMERKLAKFKKTYTNDALQQAKDVATTVASHADDFVSATMRHAGPAAKTAVGLLDSAIAAFVSTKPTGKQTDDNVDNTQTKKSYKVKKSPEGEAFIASMTELNAKLNDLDPEQKEIALAMWRKQLASTALIKSISESFGTTDPDAIVAIVNKVFPGISEDGTYQVYRDIVEQALKDIDKKPAPETVTRPVDETAGNGNIELAEDGTWLIDEAVDEDTMVDTIVQTIGKENICPV